MPLLHRSSLKDSKKSSFAILWFFNDLLWFSKVLAKLKAIKKKHICIGDPELSSNTDSSEQVLLGTIHMSLGFTVRPFPFFEFLREVLHANWTEGSSGRLGFRPEKGRPGCAATGHARTRLQHGPRRPVACWPRKQAAAAAAASCGLAS